MKSDKFCIGGEDLFFFRDDEGAGGDPTPLLAGEDLFLFGDDEGAGGDPTIPFEYLYYKNIKFKIIIKMNLYSYNGV